MIEPLYIPASRVLDAVEPWATGAYMIRETELLVEHEHDGHQVGKSAGRLDSLLVPFTPWDTPWASKIGERAAEIFARALEPVGV